MTKEFLVSAIAEKSNLTKKEADAAVNAFINVVSEELKKEEKVQIVGFGTFEVSTRAAREGRNPITGATVQIPEKKVPKFKPGKVLKDLVNA